MGPTLVGTLTGTSVGMMHDMLHGKMTMIPDIALGMVDVRDVAKFTSNICTPELQENALSLQAQRPFP